LPKNQVWSEFQHDIVTNLWKTWELYPSYPQCGG